MEIWKFGNMEIWKYEKIKWKYGNMERTSIV